MTSLVILVCWASYLHPVSADSSPNEIKTATSGSHVYVVWQQRSDGQLEKQDIYFRASSDNGATFANTIRLTENQNQDLWGPGIKEENPSVAASGSHVYVIWVEYEKGIPSGWNLAVSDDYGAHFRRPVIFTSETYFDAYILASENKVYLFWENSTGYAPNELYHLFVLQSNDYGKTFEPPVEMFSDHDITLPQIILSGDNIFTAWRSPVATHHSGNTYYNTTSLVVDRFNIQNSTGTMTHLNDTTGCRLDKLTAKQNNIYVLCTKVNVDVRENHGYNYDILYLTTSTDGGRSFESTIQLTGKYGDDKEIEHATMIVSGNSVDIMWFEFDGIGIDAIPRLYVVSGNDNGKDFGNKTLISEKANSNNLIANGNNLYVAYESPSPTVGSLLSLATSTDGGKTFTIKPLSNATDIVDQSSTIMTGDGKVNVYWKNFEGGHGTLLYLGDVDGTKVTNLLDQTPKQYQSIWTNEETIIKKPVYKKPEALVIVNGTNNYTPYVNTTVSYGPKNTETNSSSDEIKNNTGTTIPIYGGGGPMVTISLGSPLKQFRSGVSTNDVICKQGLQLIIKSEDNTPGCAKPITAFQLVKRGWGSLASLTVQTISIDNTNFSANYAITNAKILGIKSDPQSLSVIVDLKTNNDGNLVITLPQELLYSKQSNLHNAGIYVLRDGQENEYNEIKTTSAEMTLLIPFVNGTRQIEIIGAYY